MKTRSLSFCALAAMSLSASPRASVLPQARSATASELSGELNDLGREVYDQVVTLRGIEVDDLPTLRAASRMKLQKAYARTIYRGSSAERARFQAMLRSMGFVPPRLQVLAKATDLLEKQGASVFDSGTKTIWFNASVDRYGDFAKRLMIAREWVHVIDEASFRVSKLRAKATTLDQRFVLLAICEGSATGMAQQWAVAHRKGRSMAELLAVRKFEDTRNRRCFEAPLVFSMRMAAELMGTRFLTKGEGSTSLLPDIPSGVTRNVEAAFHALPRSSEQVLHPRKYWESADRDEPVVLANGAELTRAIEATLGGKVVHQDTLGEFYCGVLAQPTIRRVRPEAMRRLVGRPIYWSKPASQGWGGDRVYITDAGGKPGIVWATWWDTAQDAREFRTAYTRARGRRAHFAASDEQRLVVFAYGSAKDKVEALKKLIASKADTRKGRQPFAHIEAAGSPR